MTERIEISSRPGLRGQARTLMALGLPLIGSQLAQMAIHTTDILMLGWYDVTALAGVSLAVPLFYSIFIFGAGFAFAVMPMAASAAATGDHRQVRRATRMGLWLVMLFGLLATPLLLLFEPFFLAIGQQAEVSRIAGEYMSIVGLGLVPALLIMVMRSYLTALEHARIVLVATIATAVLNAASNYALIFGNLGMPELGVRGAAISSVLGNLFGMAVLLTYALRRTPQYALFQNFMRPDWEAFRSVYRLGWPIGITHVSEVGLFAVSSIMMGWVGTVALAAHGIALQIAAITFMLHLGLSQAVTVRVGRAWGQGDGATLRSACLAGILLSAVGVGATILLFLGVPDMLIGAFVGPRDPDRAMILAAGASLLAVAALFQTADAGQVMALGMLRGVHDTRVPMIYAAFGYWCLGVPASYVLGFPAGLGGVGIWLGLTVGLAATAGLLQYRFWTRHVPRLG